MKPSVTIPEKSQLNGSLSEPAIHGHSRPNVYQANIQYTNQHKPHPNSPNSRGAVTGCSIFFFQKFYQFGPKFWDRSNGPSRPHSIETLVKHLNESKNSSREKILPFGVCQKLTNLESTRSLLRVERFSFSPRRPPTVGSCVFLERNALSL